MLDEPLSLAAAKQLVREILAAGTVSLSPVHGVEQLRKRNMDMQDAINVLRAGAVTSCDLIEGSWRYRAATQRMTVVFAFRSKTEIRIITAWRNKR